MTSLRSFAALGSAGWLLLVHVGLLTAPMPASAQTAPARPSALRRWWNALGRGYNNVSSGDRSTTVTESGNGKPERVYQTWKDSTGATHESYWENGIARPVDPTVQQWAAARIAESRMMPPPPPPPLPPDPPEPPAPPPPHAFMPGEAGEAAFHTVQSDARLLSMVGSPVTLSPTARGSLHTWGPYEPKGWMHFTNKEGAAADLTLFLSGPEGTAQLHAKGQRQGTTWTFSTLDLTSNTGGSALNLLHK